MGESSTGASFPSSSRVGDGERTALVPEDPKEEMSCSPSHKELLLGYAMVFTHALCMTASSASVQALRNKVPHFELVLLRFLTLTVVASVFLVVTRQSPRVVGNRRLQGLLVATAFINITTFTLYYASSYFIALGPIGGLYRATTLIVSMILARVLLKERLNGLKMLALGTSVVGMVLVVFPAIISAEVADVKGAEHAGVNHTAVATPISSQAPPPDELLGLNSSFNTVEYYPSASGGGVVTSHLDKAKTGSQHQQEMLGIVYDNTTDNPNSNMSNSTIGLDGLHELLWRPVPPKLKMLGYLLILIAGLFNSAELIMLSGYLRSISSSVQAFWFGVFGTVTSALIMLFTEEPTIPTDQGSAILFTLHAIGAAMSIFTFIFALKYLPASNAAIAQGIHIALMYIAQYAFMKRWNTEFNSLLNWTEMFGTSFILIGVLSLPVNDIYKLRLNRFCGNEG